MARPGRRRKDGIRTPAGQLSRAKKDTFIPLGLFREMLAKEARLGYLNTPLGRMLRNEAITQAQFDAGQRFVETRKAADAALGLSPRTPTAQDLTALHGHDSDVESDEEIRRKERDMDRWDKLILALGIGTPQMRAMEWIAVYEREPDDYQQVIDLRQALNRLILFWGGRT